MRHWLAWTIVAVAALALLTVRLSLANSVPTLAVDESYILIDNAANPSITSNLMVWLISASSVVTTPESAAKFLQHAFAVTIAIFVFAFALHSTKNPFAALIAGGLAAVGPVLWNSISLRIPLLGIACGVLLIVAFARMNDNRWKFVFLGTLLVGSLASPIIFVFIGGLLVYLALARMVDLQHPKGEHELAFFAVLFALWLTFVRYKPAFVADGISIFWQHVPDALRASYFASITVLDAVAAVGILAFIAGVYVMYRHLFREHQREVYIAMGLALATGVVVWTKLIRPEWGLAILAIALAMLSGFAVRDLYDLVRKTRFAWVKPIVSIALLALLAVSFVPAWREGNESLLNALTADEYAALQWLRSSAPENAVILSTLDEGAAVKALAGKPVVIDADFLLEPDAAARLQAVSNIARAGFFADATRLLQEYDVSMILWTDQMRALAGVESPRFSDDRCFPRVFAQGRVSIYGVACTLERAQ